MRSAAAQHIRLENVCGFHSVRYSQMPASGLPTTEIALPPVGAGKQQGAAEVESILYRPQKRRTDKAT